MRPVFVLYPEIYMILSEHLGDDRLDPPAQHRLAAIVSCWEAALETHGDRVDKVEVFLEGGEWTFQASTRG